MGDHPAAVAANRGLVDLWAGAPVTYLDARHGAEVIHVTQPGQVAPAGDIAVTRTPGVALAALAADCVPVLLHHPGTGTVGAVHAGREGLYVGVIDAAVAAVTHLAGAAASELIASIGPSICRECYEVPASLRARVVLRHPVAWALSRAGTPALDIPGAVHERLTTLGVTVAFRAPWCTAQDPTLYSHRRDGSTGRQAGVIVCAPGVSLP